MLIHHFCFALAPTRGGVSSGVMNTVEQLTRNGIDNQIFSAGVTKKQLIANSRRIRELKSIGVDYRYTLTRFENDYGLGSLWSINKLLKSMAKPDLVVIHQIYTLSTLLGFMYAKRNGLRFAIMPHGSLTKYHESDSRVKKRIAKFFLVSKILRKADAIIVTCESEKSDLIESLHAKTHQFPYGAEVSVSAINAKQPSSEISGNFRIVFSGRFDKKKNLHLILRALPLVLMKFPDLILDVAGSGGMRETKKLQRIISSLKLEQHVQFHGWIESSKMQDLLAASKLLILPSENENFAIVVAEALGVGVPCVVSKFVGTADIVARHHAGEVINELTPSSIAEGILKVLQGDALKYRSGALEAVRESLDWSKIADKWKTLVNSLA